MAMSMMSILFVILGAGGGVNELLDAVEPRSYLQAQGVAYEVAALVEVLEEARTDELERVKAQEATKLVAMRALGALGDKAALPALHQAALQKELFFKEYAEEAIARIEGREVAPRPPLNSEVLAQELALLPQGLGAVVQVRMADGPAIDVEGAAKEALKGMPDAPKLEEVMGQLHQMVGSAAAMVGNARIDAITVGIAADVGDDSGFVVTIVRGLYDHRAVESAISASGEMKHHQVGGLLFIELDRNAAVCAATHNHFVFVAGPDWEAMPLAEIAANIKAGPQQRELGGELGELVRKSQPGGSLWGALVGTPAFKQAPPLAPFDEVVMSSRLVEGEKTRISVSATGNDPAEVKAIVDQMRAELDKGIAEFEREAPPFLAPIHEVMKSIKFASMGASASATAEIDGEPGAMFGTLVPMMLFGAGAGAPAPPAAAQPVPQQAQPVPQP